MEQERICETHGPFPKDYVFCPYCSGKLQKRCPECGELEAVRQQTTCQTRLANIREASEQYAEEQLQSTRVPWYVRWGRKCGSLLFFGPYTMVARMPDILGAIVFLLGGVFLTGVVLIGAYVLSHIIAGDGAYFYGFTLLLLGVFVLLVWWAAKSAK